jgi:hypothetical protein
MRIPKGGGIDTDITIPPMKHVKTNSIKFIVSS